MVGSRVPALGPSCATSMFCKSLSYCLLSRLLCSRKVPAHNRRLLGSREGAAAQNLLPSSKRFPEGPVLKGWNCLGPHLPGHPALRPPHRRAQHRLPVNLSPQSYPRFCGLGGLKGRASCPLSTRHLGIPGLFSFKMHFLKMFPDKQSSTEIFFSGTLKERCLFLPI